MYIFILDFTCVFLQIYELCKVGIIFYSLNNCAVPRALNILPRVYEGYCLKYPSCGECMHSLQEDSEFLGRCYS